MRIIRFFGPFLASSFSCLGGYGDGDATLCFFFAEINILTDGSIRFRGRTSMGTYKISATEFA
jgi:hypothetical protein